MPPQQLQQTLNQLKDIHLPESVSLFPATVGWYLIFLLTLFALSFWLINYWRWRPLKKQLKHIKKLPHPQQSQALIQLLKYYCIKNQPATTRLSGQAWVYWLQQQVDETLSPDWQDWICQGHLQQQPVPQDWQASSLRWLKRLPAHKRGTKASTASNA